MKPDAPSRLLVVSTQPWIYPARIACHLRSAGFEVAAASFAGSAIESACPPMRVYHLNPLREEAGLVAAIEAFEPYLVVPCDDRATGILHELYRKGGAARRAMIERSVGEPSAYQAVRSKRAVLELARGLGLPVPNTVTVRGWNALKAEVARRGVPVVLKRDGTWGGKGVRILRNAGDLRSAWLDLTTRTPLQLVRGLRHHHSLAPVKELLGLRQVAIDVQDFVPGVPANRALVCDRGRVVAGLSATALETVSATGAATVVRIVDHPQMEKTAAALAKQLGLSGFVGFDFVISKDTGEALLLEINPRATPIAHLMLEGRPHLPSVFAAEVIGRRQESARTTLQGDTIVLFPNEITRDPDSGYFATAVHDVPWDQPGLVSIVRRQLERARPGSSPALTTLARAAS